jgi:hypothetical protein
MATIRCAFAARPAFYNFHHRSLLAMEGPLFLHPFLQHSDTIHVWAVFSGSAFSQFHGVASGYHIN